MTDKLNRNKPFSYERSNTYTDSTNYIGRTYRVNDDDLPHNNKGSGKVVNIAIVEEYGDNLGAVRMTKQKTKNTKSFIPEHKLYKGYKTFLVVKFSNGDNLKLSDSRLSENPWKNNLSQQQVDNVRDRLYGHSRQSSYNIEQLNHLKSLHKKSRH